jgi:hypothetical protein
MRVTRSGLVSAVVLCCLATGGLPAPVLADHHESALIEEALSAAPPGLAEGATVMDWAGNTLKKGDNGWTCMPTAPHLEGTAPMCNDAVWMEWADAYLNKKDYAGGKFGVSYMLAGDEGASNIDPYAEGPTEDNQWVKEGPHLMILVSDPAQLEGMSTDPWNGGPYVMWKGTPYAHIMVPVSTE